MNQYTLTFRLTYFCGNTAYLGIKFVDLGLPLCADRRVDSLISHSRNSGWETARNNIWIMKSYLPFNLVVVARNTPEVEE